MIVTNSSLSHPFFIAINIDKLFSIQVNMSANFPLANSDDFPGVKYSLQQIISVKTTLLDKEDLERYTKDCS